MPDEINKKEYQKFWKDLIILVLIVCTGLFITLFIPTYLNTLTKPIPVNQTRMLDREQINTFCQIQGYDFGKTDAQNPNDFYNYRKNHAPTGFNYDNFPREIVCIKYTTVESNKIYDYNDLYKWIKS